MRAIQSGRAIGFVAGLGVCMFLAGAAHAASDTERAGSILIFTKVVNDGDRDTLIQITNTGNMVNCARCFYLSGNTCAVTDFEICLTKQQPTHWRVGDGRRVDLMDAFGTDGAGLDPGRVPPVSDGFAGALICAEVNADGDPVPINKLKGEATILDESGTDDRNTSEYNAIAFPGSVQNMDDNLELNGTEYAACSDLYRINYYSMQGQPDPVLGMNSSVVNNLTVLPCNLDLSRRSPIDMTLQFTIWDEFESQFSGDYAQRGCWLSVNLNDIGFGGDSLLGTANVRLTQGGPAVMVGESFHSDLTSGVTGSAANNVHQIGADQSAVIKMLVLP